MLDFEKHKFANEAASSSPPDRVFSEWVSFGLYTGFVTHFAAERFFWGHFMTSFIPKHTSLQRYLTGKSCSARHASVYNAFAFLALLFIPDTFF